jgi:hypothetical protein
MSVWAQVVSGTVTVLMVQNTSPGAGWENCDSVNPLPLPGSTYVNGVYTPPKPRQITATQFLTRFPPGAVAAMTASPQNQALLIMCAASISIDLTDPNVQGGINSLVPVLITQPQADAILDH